MPAGAPGDCKMQAECRRRARKSASQALGELSGRSAGLRPALTLSKKPLLPAAPSVRREACRPEAGATSWLFSFGPARAGTLGLSPARVEGDLVRRFSLAAAFSACN